MLPADHSAIEDALTFKIAEQTRDDPFDQLAIALAGGTTATTADQTATVLDHAFPSER